MTAPTWRPASFQRRTDHGQLCTLCPHGCTLSAGDVGRCRVRRGSRGDASEGDTVIETATFATSVTHILPVERKPLYHVRPGRPVLTLAAPGCTFRCSYCQNFRISQYGQDPQVPWSARSISADEIVTRALAADAEIGFSYAEPVLAAELTLALQRPARAAERAILWKTNGFITAEAARAVAPALDAVCVDLKAADSGDHEQLTGAPLAPILAALSIWRAAGVWIEVATPIIPGFNSEPAQLAAMAALVAALGHETPWHLLRFHPDYRLTDAPPTPPSLLQRARAIAADVGLRYVYVERALGHAGRDTACPECHYVCVRRDIWRLDRNELVAGRCPRCSHPLPGRW
ncbi:MAG: AmmeMemoRadiSam system radical SAM enzyme [Haliangiales bacterium]